MTVSIFFVELTQSGSWLVVPQERHLLLRSSGKGKSEEGQFSIVDVYIFKKNIDFPEPVFF